jgi:predicted Zn-dependent peptidase
VDTNFNEGYPETGMAHPLEHMCFKSNTTGRTLFGELTDRPGSGNFKGPTRIAWKGISAKRKSKWFPDFNQRIRCFLRNR